jgi:hypothetical protein
VSVWIALAILLVPALTGPDANAQSSSATLDGTVFDTSEAVVPNATVILKNQASGDERHLVSNGSGFFLFAALPPATYTVTVIHDGFSKWQGKDIVLTSGDHRSVTAIRLKPGAQTETVVVSATETPITPEDSGQKSYTIDQHILQNVAITGQNAAEFVKILPGMSMSTNLTNGLNKSQYDSSDESTGHGPVGAFSGNGQRVGAMDITSDGAHIIDPGSNSGQAMNTNLEMTEEVTVQTSNFGADSAKGPLSINTVGKSGGQLFHGEAYMYSRYYSLNANDWLNNHAGTNASTGKQLVPRPQTKYFYPGFQVGGPVILPKTNFNPNHDKLFFFFATQYYKQDIDHGTYQSVVPTAAMRNGDFTDSGYISKLNGYAVTGVPNNGGPSKNAYNNGVVDPAQIDANGKAFMGTYPMPNADPGANLGYNYISAPTRYANMLQYRGRVDYAINDTTKLYVQYNRQTDNAEQDLDTLWTGNAQSWASPTTPYPTPIIIKAHSEVLTANMTKVFSPSLTNELILNWVFENLPNTFKDKNKVERGSLGINYTMLFNHPDESHMIFPELTGWGDGISNQLNAGFELNGTVYSKKTLPSVADNVTKIWKTHTAKFGFYWERAANEQPGTQPVNGLAVFSNWGANTSGNAYADMLIGQTTQYSEQNFNVVSSFRYISTEFFGQDSWKATRKLTLDLGVRVSHLGPWSDSTGFGFGAWYPALYAQKTGGSVTTNGVTATFPGIEWHKAQSSTPLSGAKSRLAFFNPRLGFAWDAYGNGKTILRGGWGIYRFHDEQNVVQHTYDIVRGSFSSPTLWSPTMSSLAPLTGQLAVPSNVQALDPTDDRQPTTQDWNFTIAQRAPWKSQIELAYVGNKSDYLNNNGNNFSQINDISQGTLFSKYGWNGSDYDSNQVQGARPLSAYGSLKIINHEMYSNYNAMQATWNKQEGRLTWMANYTWSKALGIRGENGATGTGDPTNLKHNYGTLQNNRAHIFNIAYVYEIPNVRGGANALLRSVANGWQISGITQYQTGADLQASMTANFGYNAYIPAGTTFMGKTLTTAVLADSQIALGTPDITLMPKLTCNPAAGLHAHQYVNGNCFASTVTPGQQGDYIFPTMTGPGFFNSDLSVFKNISWANSEKKKLQFRFSGYNFLNRANRTFNGLNDPGLQLHFDQNGKQTDAAQGAPFGYAQYKTGHRLVQGEVKFTW